MATQNLGRVKIVWQGEYNSATAYVIDDAVTYEGSSYVCIKAAANKVPTNTEYWEVIAQKGRDGDATIDDTTTSETSVWSSQKTNADVQASVSLLKDTTGWLGGNECPAPSVISNQYGVTFTVDANNVITATGTSTSDNARTEAFIERDEDTEFILSGCDSGNTKVHIFAYDDTTNTRPYTDATKTERQTENVYNGNAVKFLAEAGHRVRISCRVLSGGTVTNQKFYPMVLTPEQYALNPSYRPYHKSVEEYAFPRSEQAVLGAKNLLPIKIEEVKSNNSSGTWNGNTYTLNGISYVFTVDNGYVTDISALGIANAASQVTLKHRNDGNDILTTGTAYTINGAKGNGDVLDVLYTKDGAYAKYGTDAGDGFTFVAENGTLGIALTISNGTDLTTPIAIKPMLRLATDLDDTYVPYAMTNRELTEKFPLKSVGTIADIVNKIPLAKMGSLFCSNNFTLADEMTNNVLTNSSIKFVAFNVGSNNIDWFGIFGATKMVMGRISNGSYNSHIVINP